MINPRLFLAQLCEKYKHLPAQGTKAWREGRTRTAGGSDSGTILKLNSFKRPESLIADRIGLGKKFTGNTATYWGNFTEPITRAWVGAHFNCEIIELGTLPGPIPGQTFSGDGFGVIQTPWHTSQGRPFRLDELVIFEFKSMTSRKHKFDDGELVIPVYYQPQLQVGLMTVPEAAYTIYAETTIRRCAVHFLDMSDDGACADFGPQELPSTPLGYGLVGLRWRGRAPSSKKEKLSESEIEDRFSALIGSAHGETGDSSPWYNPLLLLWAERSDPARCVHPDGRDTLRLTAEDPPLLDLARCPTTKFNLIPQAMLDDEHPHGLEAVYPLTPDEAADVTYRRLLEECDRTDSDVFGVVGYKLFTLHTRMVERDPNFREMYEPTVRRWLEVLHWALDQPTLPREPAILDALTNGIVNE